MLESALDKLSPDCMQNAFVTTPLDRKSLPQRNLDIVERVRTNPLPWPGQFSPQLVAELLCAYAGPSSVILDPFVGSGTSLVEAARLGHSARGSDLNPAAISLARVYELINFPAAQRTYIIEQFRALLFDVIGPFSAPLFAQCPKKVLTREELEIELVQLWHRATDSITRNLAAALVVLCDFHRNHLDSVVVQRTWRRLEHIVQTLPEAPCSITVYHADARRLPVASESTDLVITSPPYINVHNYHQKFRRSVEALKWDVLPIARSEIGSNRQNRGNRFLTVIQYSLDMVLALREMVRTTRRGSLLILVLGRESTVRGTSFYNGELVAEIAVQGLGLRLTRRQERVFRNRYGIQIYEDILHFHAPTKISDEAYSLSATRRIVARVLSASRALAPTSERPGLDEALERLEEIAPSPLPPPLVLGQKPA